jgi:hypothetical protein
MYSVEACVGKYIACLAVPASNLISTRWASALSAFKVQEPAAVRDVDLIYSLDDLYYSNNMAKRVTIFDPPEQDHSKALIENVLDLTPVADLGPVCIPSHNSRTRLSLITRLSI